jgi:hypothetical protein
MEEAKRRGYHVTEEDIFKEDGYSGALGIDERPVLHQLWEKYQAGEYDAIFVYRQDRLSRSLALFAALRDEARKVRRCGLKETALFSCRGLTTTLLKVSCSLTSLPLLRSMKGSYQIKDGDRQEKAGKSRQVFRWVSTFRLQVG